MTCDRKSAQGQTQWIFSAGILSSAMLLASPVATAQISLTEGINKCAAVEDNDTRLACYDALHIRLSKEGVAAQSAQRDDTVRKSQADDQDLFGFKPRAQESQLDDERMMTVENAERSQRGKWVLTMKNGQVWRQKDQIRIVTPNPGTSVTVSKSGFGSYFITVNGRSIRAERIK